MYCKSKYIICVILSFIIILFIRIILNKKYTEKEHFSLIEDDISNTRIYTAHLLEDIYKDKYIIGLSNNLITFKMYVRVDENITNLKDYLEKLQLIHCNDNRCIPIFQKLWLMYFNNKDYPDISVVNTFMTKKIDLIISFEEVPLSYIRKISVDYKNFEYFFPLCKLNSSNDIMIPLIYYTLKEINIDENDYYDKFKIDITSTYILRKILNKNNITENIILSENNYDEKSKELNEDIYEYDLIIRDNINVKIINEAINLKEIRYNSHSNFFNKTIVGLKIMLTNQKYNWENGIYYVNKKNKDTVIANNYILYDGIISNDYINKYTSSMLYTENDLILDKKYKLYKVKSIIDNNIHLQNIVPNNNKKTEFICVDKDGIQNTEYTTKLSCESKYNYNGVLKKDAPTKWQKMCNYNSECPYFEKNKNYHNNRGGCINNRCEYPLKYGKNNDMYLCYNCKGDNSDIMKCCEDQEKNISSYPNLKSPDYVFENDMIDRYNNINHDIDIINI